jgi:hypothetical protein
MTNGKFVFHKKGSETLTPAQYGYFLVRWSFDLAKASVEIIKKVECRSNGLISKVKISPFAAELQYTAVYVAAYLIYAIEICHAPESINNELNKGVDDGIKDLRSPSGAPYDQELVDFFKASFALYYKAQTKDIKSDVDSRVFNIDFSNVAKDFVEMLSRSYQYTTDAQELFEVLTALNIGVSNGVLSTYMTLKDEYGLVFST